MADIAAQVDQSVAAGPFGAKDLVTVLAGANDILAEYAKFPGVDEATLTATVEQAGTNLAGQVNRIANAGGVDHGEPDTGDPLAGADLDDEDDVGADDVVG